MVLAILYLSAAGCAKARESGASPIPTQEPAQAPASFADPSKFAVIITGVGGDDEYSALFQKWAASLQKALIGKLGFAPANVSLLTESSATAKSTASEVRRVLTELKSTCKPDSSVFVFMIGHGSYDGKDAKFNLPGPDITAAEYATLFKAIPAQRLVLVNMSSASGEFVKAVSAPGRVVVTATRSGQETNAVHFPEYFIEALTSKDADADQNQRISVQEALDYARLKVEKFYKEQNRLVTEHSLLDDNGDGKGSEKPDQGDGSLARNTFFDSLPLQLAGGNPELKDLYAERLRLEAEVEHLKARKSQMKPDEYESELEKLLLQLAEIHEKVTRKQK